MKRITLTRMISDDQGTLGVIAAGAQRFYTMELPWRGNRPARSCIPTGEYRVRWTRSPRFGRWTYQIMAVPQRDGIRTHSGNLAGDVEMDWVSHSLGCPLLGLRVGMIGRQRAVLASRSAMAMFERLMNREDFILEVKNA